MFVGLGQEDTNLPSARQTDSLLDSRNERGQPVEGWRDNGWTTVDDPRGGPSLSNMVDFEGVFGNLFEKAMLVVW